MNNTRDPMQPYQAPGVVADLPVFHEQLLARLTYPLSWTTGAYADFAAWRELARAKVIESLMAPPPPAPFDPVIVAEEDRGSYVARKVTLNISADSRILCYLLVPKGQGPFPAVLLLHDHGARFDIGKEKMIRPFDDSAARLASAQEWIDQLYGGRFIGDELARRGYVCFCTDALNWSDRGGAGYEGQQALASNLYIMGMSLSGLIAFEDLRAAEYVSGLSMVDGKCVAAMGLSMGSYRTWQLCALSDDIAVGVAICSMGTIQAQMRPGINQTKGQSAYTMIHPGLHNWLDYPDIASIACPKPMLFYNGTQDGLFPLDGVRAAYAKMRQVWTSQGVSERLETRLWERGHLYDQEMQEQAMAWLDTQLQRKKETNV